MFFTIRDLRVNKGRFALVGSVIALIALMTTLLSGLANGLVDDGISGLRALPLNHLAFGPGAHSTFSRSTLTNDHLEPWLDADGVEASALGVSLVNAQRSDGTTIDIALFGVPTDSFLAPRDEARQALKTRGIVLSHEFLNAGVEIGEELTIVGVDEKLPVLGFTYAGAYGHVDIGFTSLTTWQGLIYGNTPNGRFSAIALRSDDTVALTKLATESGTEVVTKTESYQGSPGYAAEQTTMSLIRVFLLAISALIVGAFFTVWTIQRTRQIGLLKALGASDATVVGELIAQMAIVIVVSTALGALIAIGLGQLASGSAIPFHLEPTPVIQSLVLLIVLGLAGCLAALRRITAVEPIIALGAEG
ncbi:MAG: ABC transporter permease [Ilumatobacter coccineus]|uniref:ABC transporter permease n=1 Tax=Ilumatobacter coccineus TaxID=467094 RepID=A0A2G6KCD6_9ACTN|nr:MAG: ABC transporter permease [Ilumatobacter coccineus]